MNPNGSFAISQFTNPCGEVVFRISGWLDGKRIRKNFSTRAEAEAERQAYEISSLQAGVHIAATRLKEKRRMKAQLPAQAARPFGGLTWEEMEALVYMLRHPREAYRTRRDERAGRPRSRS
jgi:hypothetical protein